jgi:hypothetical protein
MCSAGSGCGLCSQRNPRYPLPDRRTKQKNDVRSLRTSLPPTCCWPFRNRLNRGRPFFLGFLFHRPSEDLVVSKKPPPEHLRNLQSFSGSIKLDFGLLFALSRRARAAPRKPGWRNWQTQRTQNPPVLSTLGVRFPLPAPSPTHSENN